MQSWLYSEVMVALQGRVFDLEFGLSRSVARGRYLYTPIRLTRMCCGQGARPGHQSGPVGSGGHFNSQGQVFDFELSLRPGYTPGDGTTSRQVGSVKSIDFGLFRSGWLTWWGQVFALEFELQVLTCQGTVQLRVRPASYFLHFMTKIERMQCRG